MISSFVSVSLVGFHLETEKFIYCDANNFIGYRDIMLRWNESDNLQAINVLVPSPLYSEVALRHLSFIFDRVGDYRRGMFGLIVCAVFWVF